MDNQIRIDRRFAIIDEWILDLDISDRALRLYALLARYADKDTHKAFPSRKTLSERLRCSPKSVDRASQELVDAGVMTKEHRFNSSIVYTLVTTVQGGGQESPGGWSPVSRGVVTSDDLTITNELESLNKEILNVSDAQKTKHSLPTDWYPSERLLAMFDTKWPDIDREYHIEQFQLYWWSTLTKKANWDLVFQKWMSSEQQKVVDRQKKFNYRESERDRQKRELDAWIASLPEEDKK